jgi:hypothetical protein
MSYSGNALDILSQRANKQTDTNMQTIRDREQNDLKAKFAPLQQALVSTQTQMAALLDSDPDSPTYGKPLPQHQARYDELHDQAADIIGKSRLLFHSPTPEDPHGLKYLGARVADKMNITHHLADQMRQAQGDKAAADRVEGRKKDYQNATIADEGATPPPPGGLTADEQHEANRIKSNMDPKAGTSKDAPENWQQTDLHFKDGTTRTVEKNSKSGEYRTLGRHLLSPEELDGATSVPKPAPVHAESPKVGTSKGKNEYGVLTKEGWKNTRTGEIMPDFAPLPNYAQVAPTMRAVVTVDPNNPNGAVYDSVQHAIKTHEKSPQSNEYKAGAATAHDKTTQAFAQSGLDRLKEMRSIVNAHPEVFGPAAGRTMKASVWLGSQSPEAQKFQNDAQFLAEHSTAVFGGRAASTVEAMKNIMANPNTNPEALLAGFDSDESTLNDFVNPGGRLTGPQGPGAKALNDMKGKGGQHQYAIDENGKRRKVLDPKAQLPQGWKWAD